MAKKFIVEEVYKTNNAMIKKEVIRQNLINMIKNIQVREVALELK